MQMTDGQNRFIAIMLGRLEMDIDECITAYSELAAKVFGQGRKHFSTNWKGEVKAKFSSIKLDEAILDVLKKKGLPHDIKLNDGTEHGCKT